MDEFLTDDERAEQAKGWLRENGAFLVAGVVLGLGILFGWQAWENNRLQSSGEAAVVWDQLRAAIEGERFNEAEETLALLESDYAATPYLDQGRFAIARMHMDRNAPEEAITVLQAVAINGNDKELRRIAELRLAQVYLYLERYDDGLAVLGAEDSSAFAGQYHELRGDIYFAQGRPEDARDEYQLALAIDTAGVIDRSYVQMKLDDVAGSIAAMPAGTVAGEAEPEPEVETSADSGEAAADAE